MQAWSLAPFLSDGCPLAALLGVFSLRLHNSGDLVCYSFCLFVFSRQGFSVALEPVLELALVIQAGLKLTEIPASASRVWGLKACAITAWLQLAILMMTPDILKWSLYLRPLGDKPLKCNQEHSNYWSARLVLSLPLRRLSHLAYTIKLNHTPLYKTPALSIDALYPD